ncbi:hypothetical protein [Streptosporangium sandarakinum]|uniref:hypothetical protein n=1 Tax=Streptosporangium sandarakinum TaxID=1260955 RepID=UPI00344A4A0E
MDRRSGGSGRLWLGLLQRLLDANGGKMNGRFLLAVVIVALLVVAGFVAFVLLDRRLPRVAVALLAAGSAVAASVSGSDEAAPTRVRGLSALPPCRAGT